MMPINFAPKRHFIAAAAALLAVSAAFGGLAVEKDAAGVSWICGGDGGRIVGIGAMRVKQKGWRCDVSVSQGVDRVAVRATATGGDGSPHGWTLRMPLGEGAVKEPHPVKPGRWRRHPAGREAKPVEKSLGRWKVIRSPLGAGRKRRARCPRTAACHGALHGNGRGLWRRRRADCRWNTQFQSRCLAPPR